MHEGDRHAALTDGCCHALDGSGADIADGEYPRGARFESERLGRRPALFSTFPQRLSSSVIRTSMGEEAPGIQRMKS
jgi:hypothetical protein